MQFGASTVSSAQALVQDMRPPCGLDCLIRGMDLGIGGLWVHESRIRLKRKMQRILIITRKVTRVEPEKLQHNDPKPQHIILQVLSITTIRTIPTAITMPLQKVRSSLVRVSDEEPKRRACPLQRPTAILT